VPCRWELPNAGDGAFHEFGLSFPFTVRASEGDVLHLMTEPDEVTAARFAAALERISARCAE